MVHENCPLTTQLRNKKGGNSFSNFSINKEPSTSKKEEEGSRNTKREQLHTQQRQKEEKKREARIERVTSSR